MKGRPYLSMGVCLGLALLFPCSSVAFAGAEGILRERAAGGTVSEKPGGDINAGAWLVRFFRDHVSAVDGDRCPSYPSCSEYSVQAFEKHGFVMGWLMTVDRLIHEGSEEEALSGTVRVGSRTLINDPLRNNDFWWYRSK